VTKSIYLELSAHVLGICTGSVSFVGFDFLTISLDPVLLVAFSPVLED
jgi:hypothetical protein